MSTAKTQSLLLECVQSACAEMDAVEEYGIAKGDAAGLLVLHGLAMYARDVARAAAQLLRGGQTLAAASLTRVVIEHAVLAQWLHDEPEQRGSLFLQQSRVEEYRWYQVVDAAEIELSSGAHAERQAGRPRTVAHEFETPKNLFGDTEMGKQLYLTYRNLSRFVHPAATTFASYTEPTPRGGLLLKTRLQVDQNPEALAYYLASATVMCALPYLTALDEDHAAASLQTVAAAAGVATHLG